MDTGKVKKPNTIIAMLVATVLLASAALTITNIGNAFAYKSSQAGSLANACGNGEEPFNILCQNLFSQIEGDGNAVNIIGSQTGGQLGTEEPSTVGTLQVFKTVVCIPAGVDCPFTESDFGLTVTGNNPDPSGEFPGSSKGTTVELGRGSYRVEETSHSDIPASSIIVHRSDDCVGTINAGETKSCIVTNVVEVRG